MVHLYFPIIVHSSRWNVATLLHPPFGPTWLPTPQKLEKLRSSSRKHCAAQLGEISLEGALFFYTLEYFQNISSNFRSTERRIRCKAKCSFCYDSWKCEILVKFIYFQKASILLLKSPSVVKSNAKILSNFNRFKLRIMNHKKNIAWFYLGFKSIYLSRSIS